MSGIRHFFNVPVGISARECIERAGGTTISDFVVIKGGPMMGEFFNGGRAGW